jgi:hypothetical protein
MISAGQDLHRIPAIFRHLCPACVAALNFVSLVLGVPERLACGVVAALIAMWLPAACEEPRDVF